MENTEMILIVALLVLTNVVQAFINFRTAKGLEVSFPPATEPLLIGFVQMLDKLADSTPGKADDALVDELAKQVGVHPSEGFKQNG